MKKARTKFDWEDFLHRALKNDVGKIEAERAITKVLEWESYNMKGQSVLLDRQKDGSFVDDTINNFINEFASHIIDAKIDFDDIDKRLASYQNAKKILKKLELRALRLVQKKIMKLEKNGLKIVFIKK